MCRGPCGGVVFRLEQGEDESWKVTRDSVSLSLGFREVSEAPGFLDWRTEKQGRRPSVETRYGPDVACGDAMRAWRGLRRRDAGLPWCAETRYGPVVAGEDATRDCRGVRRRDTGLVWCVETRYGFDVACEDAIRPWRGVRRRDTGLT